MQCSLNISVVAFLLTICVLSSHFGALAELNFTHLENLGSGGLCLDQLDSPDLTLSTCSITKTTQMIGREMDLENDESFQFLYFQNTKVLDVSGASRYIGAKVVYWDQKSQDYNNQQWMIKEDSEDEFVQIQNRKSGLCLTAELVDPPLSPRIIQNTCCREDENQLWRFTNTFGVQEVTV